MDCCRSTLTEKFTADASRKDAERYRQRGLPRRARKLVGAVESAINLQGKTTLEVGVGAGAVTVELLRRGASHATGIDAVPAQLAAARSLADQFAVADKLELLEGDFAETATIQPADVVVLDRVVCCYPNWQNLLTAAAARAKSVLVMSYPRRSWWTRATRSTFNAWQRLTGSDFRFYIHSPDEMHTLLDLYRLRPRVATRGPFWEILVAQHQ